MSALLSDVFRIVWLLAPTVVLCTQHAQTFPLRLPAYQVRALTGNDGVDRWSDQKTWDAALQNVRIIISTYSVLNDALNNGFLRMDKLALLIFDEVHNCIGDNPGAQLMRNFYFHATTSKPAILGLSASIVNPSDFEQRFDSRVITPRRCRSELMNHANRPVLNILRHQSSTYEPGPKLVRLRDLRMSYNRETDPWIQSLDQDDRIAFLMNLNKQTTCQKELSAVYQKANHVFEQLGPALAEYFIENTTRSLLNKLDVQGELDFETSMTKYEASHLAHILQPLAAPPRKRKCDNTIEMQASTFSDLTPKALALIDFLEKEWTPTFTGLVFVQQRALAYTLAHLLAHYHFQRAQIRVEGFVGTSRVSDPGKRLIEQVLPQDHKGILEKFRSAERKVNLIVATEVLGEGVDVPQCHLVLCFDPPPQIKSFVQKRGRARHKDSKYVLMFDRIADTSKIKKWQMLEAELDQAFQLEESLWQQSQLLEQRSDPEAETREFRVSSTGALLNHKNATARLYHLCQSVQTQGWLDARPQFAYEALASLDVHATVTLPLCFEPDLRITQSSRPWKTERTAKRDAAFEALVKLYNHGLLNDHLLPLKEEKEEEAVETSEKKPSFCDVLPPLNPWIEAASQPEPTLWYPLNITITHGHDKISITVLLPIAIPAPPGFTLYWNADVQYSITSSIDEPRVLSSDELWYARRFTYDLMKTTSGSRMTLGLNDFPFLAELAAEEVQFWRDECKRNVLHALRSIPLSSHGDLRPGVIWHDKRKYLFQKFAKARLSENEDEEDVVEVSTFPKRKDFMHEIPNNNNAHTQKLHLAQPQCSVETSTLTATMVSFFFPSILRRIELSLVTQDLHRTLLPHLNAEALPSLQAAITTREAREMENYERLEFLGDAYINFITSLNLMVEQPLWPEGYLTEEKGKRVSNDTFCNAALRVGLDKYIISKAFTGQKWSPPHVHKLLAEAKSADKARVQSSKKRVADIVEATIAVAYLDGSHESALQVCKTYFPKRTWATPPSQAAQLFVRASDDAVHLEGLGALINYKFTKPALLLEAMTTGAYKGGDRNARSYERLEFLGDAVLDYLVIRRIYAFDGRKLPHHAMHSIKTSVVNSWILGFLCMEHFTLEERGNVAMKKSSPGSSPKPEIEQAETVKKHIWQFIRPGGRNETELKSLNRFEQVHTELRHALDTANKYPWPQLCRFNPSKIFSDIIESILGAICVDSQANDETCDAFLEHLGLYKILDHLLKDDVACMHPKELLGITAEQRRVDYVYGEKDRLVTCQVMLGGKPCGEMTTGETREIASTVAAEQAVELEQGGKLYDMVEKVWKAVKDDKLDETIDNQLNAKNEDTNMGTNDMIDDENDKDDDEFDVLAESKKHWKPMTDETAVFG